MIKLREIFMVDNGVGKFHGNGAEVRAADLSICTLRNYWPHYWSSRVHSERFISWIARSCSFCRSRPEPSVMGSIGRSAYLTQGICICAQTYTYIYIYICAYTHTDTLTGCSETARPYLTSQGILQIASHKKIRMCGYGSEVLTVLQMVGTWFYHSQNTRSVGQTFDKRRIYETRTQA